MSQITNLATSGGGGGSGTVTSVSGGHDINITGTPTVNPTVNLNNAITLGDLSSIIGSAALTATTGNVTLAAGNINLPATTTNGEEGIVTINSINFLYGFPAASESLFVGGAGNLTNTGFGNVCVGFEAGMSLTSGSSNTCVGQTAGRSLTTGSNNVLIGTGALQTTGANGSWNVLIGLDAGDAYGSTESGNICISNDGVGTENNTIRIGTQGTSDNEQNRCFIAGIAGVTVSNTNMVTINTATGQLGSASVPGGGGFTWQVITSSQSATVNNGYIANGSGTVVVTLPTTSAVGSLIEVTGMNNATGWKIAQNSGQQIFFGTAATTSGATGFLASTNTYDAIRIVCNVANTSWIVLSSIGNITVF